MESTFPRRIASLDDVFLYISSTLADLGVEASHEFTVDLVVEELFTNMVKFHPESVRDISLAIEREDRCLRVRLTDYDVNDFDITKVPEIDPNQPLSERPVGGLGLHLVRRLAEAVVYRYEDRRSVVEVTLHLGT